MDLLILLFLAAAVALVIAAIGATSHRQKRHRAEGGDATGWLDFGDSGGSSECGSDSGGCDGGGGGGD